MKKAPRVAILLESSTSWGALALKGIADYVRRHERWAIFVEPRGWYERPRLPKGWRGEGVIGRVITPDLAAEIEATRAPAINLSYLPLRSSRMVQVTTDETQLGRMAAEHLLSRGFRHFAYCGPLRYPHYIDRCGPAFSQAISQAGYRCAIYRQAQSPKASRNWRQQQASLARWLKQAPKPLAVFTWNGERGRQVIDVCSAVGLRVPEDVAVLGGDNDEVMCELSNPPLSCIDHGPRRIGYAAAELLAKLMAGRRASAEPVLFPPLGVVSRQSTDVLAVEDAEVARAMAFVLRHANEPIQVSDVVAATSLSRRMLELRFAAALGRSPAGEIRRLRMQRAKSLLAGTELSIPQVAQASGFNSAEVMTRTFRRDLRETPTGFRRDARR